MEMKNTIGDMKNTLEGINKTVGSIKRGLNNNFEDKIPKKKKITQSEH